MLHHLENTLLFLPPGAASPHHAQGRLSVNARLRISPPLSFYSNTACGNLSVYIYKSGGRLM